VSDLTTPDKNVRIFPNPSNGFASISTSGIEIDLLLQVFTIDGRLATSIKINPVDYSFHLQLSSGIYNYRILDGNKKFISSGDLVIQR
jgi:hypothetical protein